MSYYGGNGTYAFTGPAGVSSGGVPFDSRAATNDHCGWNLRPAPSIGGSRSRSRNQRRQRQKQSKRQRGGACSCNRQTGGGGGTGGFGFNLSNNEMIGQYRSLDVGACPPAPMARQLGGGGDPSYRDTSMIMSDRAGFGFGPAGVVSTPSAHYIDPIGSGRSCHAGGSRRKMMKKNKNKRKSQRKSQRKSRRKSQRKSQSRKHN